MIEIKAPNRPSDLLIKTKTKIFLAGTIDLGNYISMISITTNY
jgi:hypothetical protein